jgi:hypothetical protein
VVSAGDEVNSIVYHLDPAWSSASAGNGVIA